MTPRPRIGQSRAVVLLVAIGLLALVAALGAAIWVQNRNTDDTDLVEHTLNIKSRVNELAALNEQIETGRRGYLLRGDDVFRQHMEEAATPVPALLADLDRLTADNPSQQVRIDKLRQLSMERIELMAQTTERVRGGRRNTEVRNFGTDRATLITRQIRAITDAMGAEEQALLTERNFRQRKTLDLLYLVLGGTGALLLLVSAAVLVILTRAARTLRTANDELGRLNAGLEDAVEERTAELQRANDEIQRFAYIVSHDLRSPLVNVMGFTAELDAARKQIAEYIDTLFTDAPEHADENVRLAVDEDLPEALEFIRTSTAKMDRLINAILQLSRQGQRRLAPERIDMDALAREIVDSMHQRALDAGATVNVEPLPDITSDRLAIEQVLSNLIENALKYLQPGRPGEVTVRAKQQMGRLIYEVIDNGRGIDTRDHERIFELFRRSGQQDQPGEGLGLAYVRALVYRLGGTIAVESVLDQGTTFRLSLPPSISAAQ